MSVDDIVKSNMKDVPFGFDFYNPPKLDRLLLLPKSVKFGKLNVPGFVDTYTKSKAHIPSPSYYNTTSDWGVLLKGTKGKFMK